MARDISERLRNLDTRRKGMDRLGRLTADAALDVLAKSVTEETWQKRARTQPHTRYALGSMQAVGDEYTRKSLDTAERVGRQLATGLTMPVDFRLQGSVRLDVHIRGVSDVDLLVLDDRFLNYAGHGPRGQRGHYSSTSLTSLGVLMELRQEAETLLKQKYPAATVDCTGGKSISLSGGSLARPVDVVPSHWNDTYEYQVSGQEHDRGVKILNKKVPETIENLPFLHIKRVHDRDTALQGSLKKAIRLTKNVKNDAEHESVASMLPSFDIAALMYHADRQALSIGHFYELAILSETQRFLDWCYKNQTDARALRTPDDSRTILNTDDKMSALLTISVEMDALAQAVAREQNAGLVTPSWPQIEETLRKSYVPAAA